MKVHQFAHGLTDRFGYGLSYPVGDDLEAAIAWCKGAALVFNQIDEFRGKQVNLICRGSSGSILAALFASFANNSCRILHVKKTGETSHFSNYTLPDRVQEEGWVNVIIDDFVCSGDTIKAIMSAISRTQVDVLICSNTGHKFKIEGYQFDNSITLRI